MDDRYVIMQVGQNILIDFSGTLDATIGTNVIALSKNSGNSFDFFPPVEQVIPLGGTISEIVNASLGPGLFLEYSKTGRLFASGHGFMDTTANPPNQVPMTGFLFSHSDDNGRTWTSPEIVFESSDNWWFNNGPGASFGVGPREFYTRLDPANNNLIHASTMFVKPIASAFTKWGNLFYFRSRNGGKSFSAPKEVYSMIDDPVWLKKHFDPDFTSDPDYFTYGGWSLSSNHPVVYDENVILLPIQRIYPKVGATSYTQTPLDTAWDQAVVRSFDNGKTWSKVAGATEQYISAGPHDPGFINPSSDLIGSSGQSSNTIVSPFTGRIYLTYEAGNPASPDAQFFPYVLLSASSDKGTTWSKVVQINRTPINISFGAQQAFGCTAAMTLDGHYVVCYYDFRNWTGMPGEDIQTSPLPVDAWMDVYKEIDNPTGGSTGVGLDFVEEIRITPHSYNGRIASRGINGFPVNGQLEGIGLIQVNSKNELFVQFSMTNSSAVTPNITIGYQGIIIDSTNYASLFLQKYQFPKPGNQ